ncbi:hypothetical protein FACUT_10868 [Fusarium acutatum]|uniref:Nucleoside phosphorylase domain-containing protein n=1 Tax=Fusarium acutatum TaxID=78861 RepID=A0A8H4JES5_9HYPO|nr:hypothetical protein FACUT_10868 [Fusarium acutatum]
MSSPHDYIVGWICALHIEYVAAKTVLDEKHEPPEFVATNDNNLYTLGKIGKHNTVIAVLPHGEYGIAPAASVARDMLHSFPNIRIGLMVGIGGGAPSPKHDIRLGDIVVSASDNGKHGGVFNFDHGKVIQGQPFQESGFLNQPPMMLRTAVQGLRAEYEAEGHQLERAINEILDQKPRLLRKPHDDPNCDLCSSDPLRLKVRTERTSDEDNQTIHYGLITSSNKLMKDATIRDELAKKGVLCFETEAAGLMNHFPCLVIRGICDYADSYKNDEWQGYAAMAAAYAKDLLCQIHPNRAEAEAKISGYFPNEVSATTRKVNTIIHHQQNQENKDILQWLTPANYSLLQSDNIGRRQPGTGQWFINSSEFCHWRDSPAQTLFCPGIPGAGKTILTSIVIDSLEALFSKDKTVGIAYVYCNFQRQNDQTAKELLGSLKQLLQSLPAMPESIKLLYERHRIKESPPSLKDISSNLLSTTKLFSRVFIMIDALDECSATDGTRARLLEEVFKLRLQAKANVFVTSRPIPDAKYQFDNSIILEIRAADEDAERFLRGHIPQMPGFFRREGLEELVISEIVRSVEGMFLLAQLHLDSLHDKVSVDAFHKALARLSSGSDAYFQAYETAMERLMSQSPSRRDLAKRVIAWITCALRPLAVEELRHALAVEVGKAELNRDALPETSIILQVCVGLVTVGESDGSIRLVHYTTQEYFEKTKSSAQSSMAFGRRSNSQSVPKKIKGLHLAAYFGNVAETQILLLDNDPDLMDDPEEGHIDIVQLLLANGVDVNRGDIVKHTPLLIAAFQGNEAVVQLLLDNNAEFSYFLTMVLGGDQRCRDPTTKAFAKMAADAFNYIKTHVEASLWKLSDAEAERSARSVVEDIQRRRTRISEKIDVFGNILLSRWKKRSQAKRVALLKEVAPDLEEQPWFLPRYTYMREKYYIHARSPTRRRRLLLPWLNVHVLKTNPAVLFALLHYRTAYPPQSWAPFDSRQLTLGWAAGFFDVDFSAKCVVMYGDGYGSLVDWEAKTAHRADTVGYPRAMLVLEAQAYLLEVLCNIVNKILEGADPLQPPRNENWHQLVSHEAFRETGAVEFWSPYTNQAFSRPPMFNCDYLLDLAKSRLDETGDHLWYLQCDGAYMRRHVKIMFATEVFKKASEQQKARMFAQHIAVEVQSHCWWRWIEMECKHVEAVRKRFSDSIYPGMPLPPKYDKALGALELLLVNQVIYRASLLERLLPHIPGMQKHWKIDSSQASSESVGLLKRTTLPNTQESLTEDPLDWCLVQLQGQPDDQRTFDHAMLFAMLQDHLSSNPSEGKRLDEITYQILSDLSTCHEMLMAVRSHRPRNVARTLPEVYDTEHRESWKMRDSTKSYGLKLERVGSALIRDFYHVKPPTGPKNAAWISQSRALRAAMEKFWASLRGNLREHFRQNDPAFTEQEVDNLLGVVSAHLSEQYIQGEQRAEAEILATIQTADKPQSFVGTFHEDSEPRFASTMTALGQEKVKTRGEQGSSASDVAQPRAEDAGEVTKDAIITLPEESIRVIRLMFPSKDDAVKDVTWNRFVNMMTKAGFTARNNTGSAVAFKQVSGTGAGGRIVFHKPHPADKIDPILLRIMGKRMTKWFGWKRELFALQGEATLGVQG